MNAHERPAGWRLRAAVAISLLSLLLGQAAGGASPAQAYEEDALDPEPQYCHPEMEGVGWPQDPNCSIPYEISTYYDCCNPDGTPIEYGGPIFNTPKLSVTRFGSHSAIEARFTLYADFSQSPDDGNRRVMWETLAFRMHDGTGGVFVMHADPVSPCAPSAFNCAYEIDPVEFANAVGIGAGDPPEWYSAPIEIQVVNGAGACCFEYGRTSIMLGLYRSENKVPQPNITVHSDDADLTYDFIGSAYDDDEDLGLHEYYWDFGDGATAEGQDVEHTYAEPGDYRVTLYAVDPDGAEGYVWTDLGRRLIVTEVDIPEPPTEAFDEFDAHVTVRNDSTKTLHCVNGGAPDIRPASSFTTLLKPPNFVQNTLAPRQEITFDYRFAVKDVLPSALQFVGSAKGYGTAGACPGTTEIILGSKTLDLDLAAPPPPPIQVAAAPGNRSVAMSWQPPLDLSAGPITSYTAMATPGGATCTTSTLGCTIAGLVNGRPYTVQVRALNDKGTGAPSSVIAVTPRTTPGAARSAQAVAGAKSARVSWTAPRSDGGAPVEVYRATATPGGATCASRTGTSCRIAELRTGRSYTVTVRAKNAAGWGPASAPTGPVVPKR